MKRLIALCFLAPLLGACVRGGGGPEIMGVKLGASRDEAHARLRQLGTLERTEAKQQEVWKLSDDAPYSHLFVGYDREASTRYVTAVAKEGRVRYTDVIDTGKAQRAQAGSSVTYTLEVPGGLTGSGHVVKAKGSDPQFLRYYSIKGAGSEEEEEEEERK